VREWKDLTSDEKEIISTMKMQDITPEELLQRMRNSGKMNEEAIEGLKKALDDVKPFLVH
jgi:aminoglycoside phosphotransferase family enzyme